jgi:hypothetical protein
VQPLAGFVVVPFVAGVNVAAGVKQYIAASTSLLSRRSLTNVYTTAKANGPLMYINSWYQYSVSGTYPVPVVRPLFLIVLRC